MKLTVTIDGVRTSVDIPMSLNELKWSNYVNSITAIHRKESNESIIGALLGVDAEIIESLEPWQRTTVESLVSFVWSEEQLVHELSEAHKAIDIAIGTWQQLIDSEQELKRITDNDLPQIAAASAIVRIYTKDTDKTGRTWFDGLNIDNMATSFVLPIWLNIQSQFFAWQERWIDLYTSQADDNEVAAGIERLQTFGWFGTLNALANGDPLKYDDLLKIEANVIYTRLLYGKEEREYVERKTHYDTVSAASSKASE